MSAFVIATVTVKNAEKFAEYGQRAGASMAPFGGEIVRRGKLNAVLSGSADHGVAALIRFPDQASLSAWYASPAYQSIVPLRDEAADMTLLAYDALP